MPSLASAKTSTSRTQQEISEVSRQVDAVETLVWVIVVLVVAIVLFLLYCRFFGDREDDSPSLAPTLTDEERSVLEQHQKDKEAKARQQAQQ